MAENPAPCVDVFGAGHATAEIAEINRILTANPQRRAAPRFSLTRLTSRPILGPSSFRPISSKTIQLFELEDGSALRETPLPPGTPVSFGHYENIREGEPNDLEWWINAWYAGPNNYGVALVVVDPLENVYPIEDQQIHFRHDAVLRITLDRNSKR